ncbi:GHKL domain-containing protein [Bacillus sp. DNRA2]|uniref:histidine kinase N-terminal domain-containing protein n=1 Tax=Bacillus sp. DNRA2 TaxID=2723053 RepID=UPI00145DB24D|nr:histidine kinase N-terminal domain-containing protein [Bacillus sp. DNRA2]NMD72017.1 GHKL domain-containing protein [Bacillus sp. DNRA2]
MIATPKNRLLDFLIDQKDNIFVEWENRLHASAEDPFKEKVRQNRELIYNTILKMLTMSVDELDSYMKVIAINVGKERVQANSNIGDFVYNVNVGRSVLSQYLMNLQIEWGVLKNLINEINNYFDKFTYYAVTYYTEAKDRIIEEKNNFIDSTHQDRLTLLGQMTSSFVHEFRNPLTSIQGFIQLLKAEHDEMKYLDIISNELEQLNFRISQFLLLSKKEVIGKEKVIFSLNELVEEVISFLYPSILDSKVKVLNNLNLAGVIYLFGYADEIRQVFINIIFNALDVLSQYRDDPTIQIKCYRIENNCIKVLISNNGPMIPEQQLNTIFEPFVTTKKLGTGLGLFVCREIIEKHKGTLTCQSIPEQTNFIITLPIAAVKKES